MNAQTTDVAKHCRHTLSSTVAGVGTFDEFEQLLHYDALASGAAIC